MSHCKNYGGAHAFCNCSEDKVPGSARNIGRLRNAARSGRRFKNA